MAEVRALLLEMAAHRCVQLLKFDKNRVQLEAMRNVEWEMCAGFFFTYSLTTQQNVIRQANCFWHHRAVQRVWIGGYKKCIFSSPTTLLCSIMLPFVVAAGLNCEQPLCPLSHASAEQIMRNVRGERRTWKSDEHYWLFYYRDFLLSAVLVKFSSYSTLSVVSMLDNEGENQRKLLIIRDCRTML